MSHTKFEYRHIGPDKKEVEIMLAKIGAATIDELISQTIPENIRLKKPLSIGDALSEYEYLVSLKELGKKNKVYKSFLGLGYHNCIVPPAIQRNILENPGWYTAYTPYQAEIAQGRLEALLNFQTMIMDLTGMEIANASLLDEATAAAEAMIMIYNNRSRDAVKRNVHQFFVSKDCFPQTIALLQTRSAPLGIELIIDDHTTFQFTDSIFGGILQYPAIDGKVADYAAFVEQAHSKNASIVVAADLLSLALLTPPGEWGADVVVGNSQRFGVPMGYGGPHAAFFASKEEFKRILPGRIIGVSVDVHGNPALRMALQTREQHIRRDKATSNICTAQALLAIMAGMFAVYHGASGIKAIAKKINTLTALLGEELSKLGYSLENEFFFDTLKINFPQGVSEGAILQLSIAHRFNFRYPNPTSACISVDETTSLEDVNAIINIFAQAVKKAAVTLTKKNLQTQNSPLENSIFSRKSAYLTHKIFNSFHSETELMRYIKRLENKDLSLTHSMISLGSCTMKLNAAAELIPITWTEFAYLHPYAPIEQAEGYQLIFKELEKMLCEITGFAAMSFQPNSGAQGEYAGLLVIREYHISRGDTHRDIALIPSSAHGTNPASAAMAGMQIIVVKCDEHGNIDITDLRQKAELHKDKLSCLMVTYPSTHGVYEEGIIEITDIIHTHGGQVYMDGANMNAQVGLTSPGNIGADVCHLNLHKTFAIPHGGGGPGMGPIGVAAHLAPFLPSHPLVKTGGEKGIKPVSAAPWGSALILLISYAYCKMLGSEGVTNSTKIAILNANYIKESLKNHYTTLYTGKNGRCAHEMILDCSEFKKTAQVEVADIAKRLMDYGFHAPTVSFPVHDTIMVEPTESESLAEIDRFCQAMISIRKEIDEIAAGKADMLDNVIKNAPHTCKEATSDKWSHSYSRQKAIFPLHWVSDNKFWPSVGRIDNAYGDRNLICSCPSIESYEEELANS